MDTAILYLTNRHWYSVEEANQQLRAKVSEEHWLTLLSNICRPEIACKIDGFIELRGELYLLLDYELHSPGFILC